MGKLLLTPLPHQEEAKYLEKPGKTETFYQPNHKSLSTQTCRYSWKCCTCCLWPWAGRPGLCGDSPRRRCHYRGRRARCPRCTGKSWSFPGGPRRGLWQRSGRPPRPADRGFPGEARLSVTHWIMETYTHPCLPGGHTPGVPSLTS